VVVLTKATATEVLYIQAPEKGENGKGKNWAKRGRGLVEKRLLPKAIYMQFSHIFCPYSVFPLHRNPASGCL